MANYLCKLSRKNIQSAKVVNLLTNAQFVCRSCARSANTKKVLCKPRQMHRFLPSDCALASCCPLDTRSDKVTQAVMLAKAKKALKEAKRLNEQRGYDEYRGYSEQRDYDDPNALIDFKTCPSSADIQINNIQKTKTGMAANVETSSSHPLSLIGIQCKIEEEHTNKGQIDRSQPFDFKEIIFDMARLKQAKHFIKKESERLKKKKKSLKADTKNSKKQLKKQRYLLKKQLKLVKRQIKWLKLIMKKQSQWTVSL